MEAPPTEMNESKDSQVKVEVVSTESITPASEKQKDSEPEVQPVKKSREEKGRKKDDRSVEQVLKALSSLGTSEEKLAAMCKKYSDIFDENRKLQASAKQCDKKVAALQREKEQLQADQSKAVLTRSRLESLCRELQRQNKAIKEESLLKIREEEEKRKVVSAKFQTTLSEITALMQQNNENNSKLRDENIEMQNKFKSVCEQYELREQQVEKISKQMQLESQLADAKLAKVKIEMVAEKELLANEKKQLLIELAAYQNKCQELQKTEAALRSQISMYTEKYDEFQNALARSNQIYGGFKMEMEKMSKKITKLEKETSTWKMKWESSHRALLQMAAEKQQRDADLALATRQLAQLQKLCRTLQSERSSLLSQLKNEGLTPKLADDNSCDGTNPKQIQECEHQPAIIIPDEKDDALPLGNCVQNDINSSVTQHPAEEKVSALPINPNEVTSNTVETSGNEVKEEKSNEKSAVELPPNSNDAKPTKHDVKSPTKDAKVASSETKNSKSDDKLTTNESINSPSQINAVELPNEVTSSGEENQKKPVSSTEINQPTAEEKPTSVSNADRLENTDSTDEKHLVPDLNNTNATNHHSPAGDAPNKSSVPPEARKSKEGSKRRKK